MSKAFNLADNVELLHILFDSYVAGITIVQPDGTIIYYNDAQASLDGLQSEQALGKTICDVYRFSLEDSPTMQAVRQQELIVDNVHFYRTRTGNKLVNATLEAYPLYKDDTLVGGLCCIRGYSPRDNHIYSVEERTDTPIEDSVQRNTERRKNYTFANLVGNNSELLEAIAVAEQSSQSSSPVMIIGETGVGKEIFAQAIHSASSRASYPYTAVNCSAMPENLLESILFGTTRGAFTGAIDKAGLFEVTEKGTIFLDELDSMPVSLQSKLLRVLQEKCVRRIGDSHERDLDVRILSSVTRNPIHLVQAGALRPDFYYRLGVVKVFIPPLKNRLEDMHLLAQYFVDKHCRILGIGVPLITPEAMGILYKHSWPGNVRELEHAIEATLNLLGNDGYIEPRHLLRACPDIFTSSDLLPSKSTPWLAYQAYLSDQGGAKEAEMDATAAITTKPDGSGGNRPDDSPTIRLAEPPSTGQSPHGSDKTFQHLGASVQSTGKAGEPPTLHLHAKKDELEEKIIRNALTTSAGNLALAAKLMGISPQLMQYKVKKFAINTRDYIPRSL